MVLAFLCAVLSNQAAVATGSETVENDIIDGKNPVCALWWNTPSETIKMNILGKIGICIAFRRRHCLL